MFMLDPHRPVPADMKTREAVKSTREFASVPVAAPAIPNAQIDTPMRPAQRAPIFMTIGPEVGSVNKEPKEAIKSIMPMVPGVNPRWSRTSGKRESHAEVAEPRPA